jgi:hypothetical protein
MYLFWYDDTAKKATTRKIEEAIAAYEGRFRSKPNIVLVNETERSEAGLTAMGGCAVQSENYIRRNNYWVGEGQADKGTS